MKQSNLFERLEAFGFPLFEPEKAETANETLADMVKANDLRFWEGFPVVLANCAERGLFDYDMVSSYLKKPSEKKQLAGLVVLSLALYEFFSLKFLWYDELYKLLVNNKKDNFNNFLMGLKGDDDLHVSGKTMSAQRLKSVFSNYFTQSQKRLNDLLSVKNEFSLEYSLSQVFSPKQKDLFFKKIKGEKLTKTEKEYYSRAVKKKVVALANPELHRLAQRLLE